MHRLAYSFGWDGSEAVPPGSSLVEIDLIEQPPDGTLLRLTHTGLPNADQCAGHADGWAHYLGRLAQAAAGRDPGPGSRGAAAPAGSDCLPLSISPPSSLVARMTARGRGGMIAAWICPRPFCLAGGRGRRLAAALTGSWPSSAGT